ncbi:chemotaxis protein CheA [Burkholderia vietnamiensis]|uniref:chemotaxis protein CheA n=1 Tax=Burkholderia vietnamiensis TaxID=60552 RepID=UPI0009C1A693|nr:chemotaxis protein CheA [Burkholderia vietnamiensis]
MNSNKIRVACAAMFAMTTIGAQAQTADSTSSAQSTTSSTAISQGGGSSMNTNVTSSRGGSATSSSTSGVRGSGNSSVQVNVTMPPSTSSGSNVAPQSVNSLQAAGAPGTNPYNTQMSENVNYSGTQTIKTNPAIQAPGLTTTLSDTCMGSVSLGVSFPGFGATGGTTLVDQACVRRLDAREFRAMGLTDVALALLCQSDANRRAVEATGHLCPGTTAPLARSNVAPSAEATVADDVKYRDPLVRSRMGLPPLDAAVPASGQTRPIASTAVQTVPMPLPVPVAASSIVTPSANAVPAAPQAATMKASPAIAAVPADGAAPIAEAASARSVAPAATNPIPATAIVAAPTAADKAPEAAPAIADKAPEPTPVEAEKAADPAPTVAEKAPEPLPAVVEKAPEPAPVVAEKAAEPAPAIVDKAPEPAPVVAEKAPEPTPATDNAAQATPAAEIPAVAPAPADQEAAPAMPAPAVISTSTSS